MEKLVGAIASLSKLNWWQQVLITYNACHALAHYVTVELCRNINYYNILISQSALFYCSILLLYFIAKILYVYYHIVQVYCAVCLAINIQNIYELLQRCYWMCFCYNKMQITVSSSFWLSNLVHSSPTHMDMVWKQCLAVGYVIVAVLCDLCRVEGHHVKRRT